MILLINPAVPSESPWGLSKLLPPLGLAYVAASLEQAGFQVEIFDNYLHRKQALGIKEVVEKKRPEIVGLGCNSVNYRQCVEIAKAVKSVEPSCKIMVGGPHPSCVPESVLEHKEIDYAVMGEGEKAAVELARYITGKADAAKLSDIAGVAYRYRGGVRKNPPALIEDLDTLPFPARHLLQMNEYDRNIEYLDVKPADVMNAIRGCPYNCRFCETKKIWGYKCRAFSPGRIVAEIEYLMKRYGSKGIYFIGDNFTIFKDKTLEFCRLLRERGISIEWACDTRVDLVSQGLLKEMKHAGCKTIWFGVESGSPHILEKLSKGVTVEQIMEAFRLCRDIGIRTACSFMMGIPGETIEDMENSLKLAKKLDPDWCQFNIYVGCPGSELYEEVIENGLYDRKDDFIVYVRTDEFNYERLLEIQRRFMKEFYGSPRRMLRSLKRKILRLIKLK